MGESMISRCIFCERRVWPWQRAKAEIADGKTYRWHRICPT